MSWQTVVLRGGGKALVLLWREGEIPSLAYWGPETADVDKPEAWQWLAEDVTPQARMDWEEGVCLAPGISRGNLLAPLLLAHNEKQVFATHFETQSVLQHSTRCCEVVLHDALAGLSLHLTLDWDGDAQCLVLSSALRNLGPHTWYIQRLDCPTVPLSADFDEAMTFPGRWGKEYQVERTAIGRQALLIEHREGRTGPQHQPSCVVGSNGFNDEMGLVLGAHLGTSGNYHIRIERHADGRAALQAGVWLYPGEKILRPSKQWQTPSLYVARSRDGLNGLRHCFHRRFRTSVLPRWTRQVRPIHANSWEAVYFDHRQYTLFDLVTAAADVGAERFVLDDGWFRGRRHDRAGLGDWQVCPDTYPEGLHLLVAHVHRQGMQFGLWVEPEMINPDSELARMHPDWVLQAAGYPNPTARHQWVLDLSNHAAFQWIFEQLKALLDEYPIAYLKWDMNRPHVLPAGLDGQAKAQAQCEAVYRLMQQLMQYHPNLEIESCASGGGRVDAGILKYCGRVWTSDNNDPVARASIHANASVFFPPEILGTHIGPECAHLSGRRTEVVYRAMLALQGQFGFELDLRDLDEASRSTLIEAVKIYRRYRTDLAEAEVWRHQRAGVSFCTYRLSMGKEALVWATVENDLPHSVPPRLSVPGLLPGKRYRVSVLMASDFSHRPAWMEQSVCLPSELLLERGLPLPVMLPSTGLLLSLELDE